MLKKEDLKIWLHKDLPQRDKLLLILAAANSACQLKDLKNISINSGFKIPAKWNPSVTLSRTKGLAIRTPLGWEITEAGKQHLANLGVTKISPNAVNIATDLRSESIKIKSIDTRTFMEEAIKCYELGLYRSAVIMSWLAAVHVLHHFVFINHLKEFNQEASRIDADWKKAKTVDDLSKMKERDFLERIAKLSIINGNVKKELISCLDFRNGCGHPNSMKIGPNMVSRHIEVLILNIFKIFP